MTFLLLAQLLLNNTFAIEGFYPDHHLPVEFQLERGIENKLMESSLRLRIGRGLYANCSAQFISNTGYLITALHCIDPSADIHEAISMWMMKDQGLTYFSVGNQTPENVELPSVKLRRSNGDIVFNGAGKLVMVGKGFSGFRPRWNAASGFDLDERGQELTRIFSEDFMIIKLEKNVRNCVKTNTSTIENYESKAWGLGYPIAASRTNYSSDGESQYFTVGYLRSSMQGHPDLEDATDDIVEVYNTNYITHSRMIFDGDAFSEMSGGMLVNSQGELIGLVVGGHHTREAHTARSTEIVRASYVYQQVIEKLGTERALEIFNCQ